MFITTMRVRRARNDTLAQEGIDRDGRELAEVTCHASPIAVFDVTEPGAPVLVWVDPHLAAASQLGDTGEALKSVVAGAMATMDAYHASFLSPGVPA